jgi:hypothetical protein
MGEIVKKVSEIASDKSGYIKGIKYYYDILMRTPGLSEEKTLYRAMLDFGVELEDLLKFEGRESVQTLSEIFDKFYPEGVIHPVFDMANMGVALDGISECLYRLKKEFHIGKFS